MAFRRAALCHPAPLAVWRILSIAPGTLPTPVLRDLKNYNHALWL